MANLNWDILNLKIDPSLQSHMKMAYSCVAISKFVAALGGFFHLFIRPVSVVWCFVIGLGFILALMKTYDDGEKTKSRLSHLLPFTFLSGLGLGLVNDFTIALEPSVIPITFLCNCFIFMCFTFTSMFTDQRRYLYIGGTLMSTISVIMTLSLLNIFIGSHLVFNVYVYIGLAGIFAFVLNDTQMIMEKHRNGDKDYIWHSVCLFFHLIQIFQYWLTILTDKESNKKKK